MKIEHGDVTLNVEISGPEQAQPLLMAHSLGCDHRMWAPQVAALQPQFRLIQLDMRGHGLSSVTDQPFSLDDLADDVIAVMDALNLQQAHWLGLSIGGMIGQSLLLRHPQRIQQAMLCDTAAALPDGAGAVWQQRIDQVQQHGLGSIMSTTLERWFTPAFLEAENTDAAVAAALRGIREQLSTTTDAGYCACSHAITGLNYLPELHRVKHTVALVVGAEDQSTPVAASEQIAAVIEGSTLSVLEQASHIANVEQASAFNRLVLDFFTS